MKNRSGALWAERNEIVIKVHTKKQDIAVESMKKRAAARNRSFWIYCFRQFRRQKPGTMSQSSNMIPKKKLFMSTLNTHITEERSMWQWIQDGQ